MTLALLTIMMAAVGGQPADTLVICPEQLQQALVPWVEHRTQQRHRVEVISNPPSAMELRQAIRLRAKKGSLKYVVLVGDAVARSQRGEVTSNCCVPTYSAIAKVTPRYGSEPTIASDNWYADLDDDVLPDLAVGRLTADTPEQLTVMVDKILAYERSTDFGSWRRRINLVGGIGGFGPLADAAIESAARRVITTGVPAAYVTRVTYGNWRSPYCPDPRQFRESTINSLCEGSLCWVYMGHAWPHRLADIQVPDGAYRSLDRTDLVQVRSRHGVPIAFLLACYTGAFDFPDDCLAEEMLAARGGPIAVLCGSRVTMPYAMSVLGYEMMEVFFAGRPETLGQAVMQAKRQMVAPNSKSTTRAGLDGLAAFLNPGSTQDELIEHLWLFNLLGDPTLRLRFPAELRLDCPKQATSGNSIDIKGAVPIAGRITVELVPARDRLTFRPPRREKFVPTPDALAEFTATYRQANETCLIQATQELQPGPFTVRLRIPADTEGPCHIRAFLEGHDDCASGCSDLEIESSSEIAVKNKRLLEDPPKRR